MPSVDVLVPNYQYGHFLRQCVHSILGQGIDDLRVLIIDNASTDDSLEVAARLRREDPRVQVLARPTNEGRLASLNAGLDWAKSDYFLMLCADDLLVPGALTRAVAAMEAQPAVVFASGSDRRYTEGEPVPDHPVTPEDQAFAVIPGGEFLQQRCVNFDCSVSVLTRTSAQQQAGHFRAQAGLMTDVEMQLRLACIGDVALTPSALVMQRVHATNLSHQYWGQATGWLHHAERAFNCFFEHESGRLAAAGQLRQLARRNLASRAYWSGWSHVARGKPRAGLELLRFAGSRSPICMIVPPVSRLLHMNNAWNRVTSSLAGSVARLTSGSHVQASRLATARLGTRATELQQKDGRHRN